MLCTLMHKTIPVCELDLSEQTGYIKHIGNVFEPARLPVGVSYRKGIVSRPALNEWWTDRSIPASRSGIRQALETLKVDSTRMLLTRCLGLSLSDQYWICPVHKALRWEDINFFDNPFTEDIGDILIGKPAYRQDHFDFHSPDNTSDGNLKKRWKIISGKRCLIKGGSNPFQQQPFNEVIATSVMRRLGIPHAAYTLYWDAGVPYSICEDFVTRDTELISAWRVMQTQKKDNSTSVYQHYLNCCRALNVPGIVKALNQMIVLDYLIANEDRHQNNFGLLRDANTLQWLCAAPIFDSGSSLGYDKLPWQIERGIGVECKPFKRRHEEQLALVTDFDWINFSMLTDLADEASDILRAAGDYMDVRRRDAILHSLTRRLQYLQSFAQTQRHTVDNIQEDVLEDVQQNYLAEHEIPSL